MNGTFLHNAVRKWKESAIGAWVCDGIQHTPRHAIHWYIVLVIFVLISSSTVLISLFVAPYTRFDTHTADETQQEAVSIDIEKLNEVVEIVRLRKTTYEQLLTNTPEVIDLER
tara:strand:- start:3164 stop:3502 length:339 start_codon:yes stop_codon:yes gene_type:complete